MGCSTSFIISSKVRCRKSDVALVFALFPKPLFVSVSLRCVLGNCVDGLFGFDDDKRGALPVELGCDIILWV